MKKLILTLITAVLILTSFTACSNDKEPVSTPASSPVSENSGSSEQSSEPGQSTPSEPQKPAEEPTFLKGPDGKPIYPSDLTYIIISDKNAPDGEREADVSELTEGNLKYIECNNFGYLREPTGIRYNYIESPEKFESERPYRYIGERIENTNPIKRMNVGDTICGMTITEIKTNFQNNGSGKQAFLYWNDMPQIRFKGEITLTGYMTVQGMIPDYPGTEGLVSFWLDEQSAPLPITYINNHPDRINDTYEEYGAYSENYIIELGTIYDDGIFPATCDESLLDGITYGDRDVHVKITIDEFNTFGMVDNAVLKSLERL